jgi:hypothetical protein
VVPPDRSDRLYKRGVLGDYYSNIYALWRSSARIEDQPWVDTDGSASAVHIIARTHKECGQIAAQNRQVPPRRGSNRLVLVIILWVIIGGTLRRRGSSRFDKKLEARTEHFGPALRIWLRTRGSEGLAATTSHAATHLMSAESSSGVLFDGGERGSATAGGWMG